MKKVIVFVLALFLILSMAGACSAENKVYVDSTHNVESGHDGLTYLSYNVDPTVYMVTIPVDMVFDNLEDTMVSYVNVTNVLLEYGKAVEVGVQSAHKWVMELHKNDVAISSTTGILYNMTFTRPDTHEQKNFHYYMGVDAGEKQVICQISEQTDLASIMVKFKIYSREHIDHSGKYQDKLTFTVRTIDKV